MRCMVCGREAMNPEANFCDYCGSSFREAKQSGVYETEIKNDGTEEGGYSAFGTGTYREQGTMEQRSNEQGKPVSIWTYLGAFLLPLVPGVGALAFLVLLFYWAFAANVDKARKNFGRAYLIYLGLAMLLLSALMGPYMEQIMGQLS